MDNSQPGVSISIRNHGPLISISRCFRTPARALHRSEEGRIERADFNARPAFHGTGLRPQSYNGDILRVPPGVECGNGRMGHPMRFQPFAKTDNSTFIRVLPRMWPMKHPDLPELKHFNARTLSLLDLRPQLAEERHNPGSRPTGYLRRLED